jgi:hypothetical protein
MALSALQSTITVPATPNNLATLLGLPAGTLFTGYYAYPSTNNAAGVTEAVTTPNGTAVIGKPGKKSPNYTGVNLSTIVISSAVGTDQIIVKGQHTLSSP